MPLQISTTDRKILIAAGIVFAVLMAAAAFILSPENKQTIPTTYSANSYGAKAALLLLTEIGYNVARYERSPVDLVKRDGCFRKTTLIIAEPSIIPTEDEREAIKTFIRGGGLLIATGSTVGAIMPESDIQIANTYRMTDIMPEWEEFSAVTPSEITTSAQKITLSPQAFWGTRRSTEVLYGTNDRPVVVRYSYGDGTVLWWASATPLTNAGVTLPGNLEFFIASIGGKENRILWDEYFHGYRNYKKTGLGHVDALFFYLLIQSVLLGATVIWTFSRRSGPVRPQLQESRLSPMEFVETLGNLYQRARAASVAVDIYYQRFIYLLCRRLGISPNDPPERVEQAARRRWGDEAAELSTVLKKCASSRHRRDLPPKQALELVRSLSAYAGKMKIY